MSPIRDGKGFNLDAIRKRLQSERGPRLWRSLNELAEDGDFKDRFESEFPGAWTDGLDRRSVLKLIGASLALAGLSACSRPPDDRIVPYVHEPEDLIPGHPRFYATAMPLCGFAKGVLVESHLGRPTKIEGNPRHPASLGATDHFGQASILSLYDPDRSQSVLFQGRLSDWTNFTSALAIGLEEQGRKNGSGLRILTGAVTSPTLIDQMQRVLKKFPEARWHHYEPDDTDGARSGSQIAFGQNVNTYYRIAEADVILSLDSDFLTRGPAWLRYSREWASRRDPHQNQKGMNRLYAVESSPTCTGAVADHRLGLKSVEIETFGRAVAQKIGVGNGTGQAGLSPAHEKLAGAIAGDLLRHRGSSLVIPGEYQPGPLHALAHIMNQFLENAGTTVVHTDPVAANSVDSMQSLRELTNDMKQGKVDLLIVLGANPVFTAPADVDFGGALGKVPLAVHLGLHYDETAARCLWHVPEAHYLESWGDVRAFDGTVTILQPLIAPLYDGHAGHELLAMIEGAPASSGRDIVRNYWQAHYPVNSGSASAPMSPDFEKFWESSLEAGIVANTALPARQLTVNNSALSQGSAGIQSAAGPREGLEIIFRPDPSVFDGRFANNGWLQELPKPLTKITWGNAVLIGTQTAGRLGFDWNDFPQERSTGKSGPVVELKLLNRSIQAPVFIMPGHPEDSVTVFYGYGRSRAGKVGNSHGYNAYLLRRSESPAFDTGLEIRRTKDTDVLATTQQHFTIAGRDLVRILKVQEYQKEPDILREGEEAPRRNETLYHAWEWPYREYKWAMTVDLSRCIGCNACVVACAAENNTPVVGKTQVGRQREMQWLRIDRYYMGDPEGPGTHFEPMFCQHCELAPCELVCPVHATNHNSEGINQMVYNRCVGTRFCSHNCPYKVRRFNFLQYSDYTTPNLEPMRNPDVTVRSRGVMEKCTYCIQRIQEAKIAASKENRKVRDGEILTACQQACPTRVFTFGDLNDPASAVRKTAGSPLNYGLLAELNTRPRTTYLAALKNPNPELGKGGEK